MADETLFVAGDRVWVFTEEVWWPAKILDSEEAELLFGQPKPEGQDYAVQFYGTDDSYGFAAGAHVEAFEDSSGKAVTSDEALRIAIKKAAEDRTANPLRVIAPKRQNGDRMELREKAPKRQRTEGGSKSHNQDNIRLGNDSAEDDAYPRTLIGFRYEQTNTLVDIAIRLAEANKASDLTTVRKQLLRLDRVKITRDQLAATKVGVAIGDILGNASLHKLWPLAQALINFFVLALPKVTLEAIQHYHEVHESTQEDLDVAKAVVAAAAAKQNVQQDVSLARKTLEKVIQAFAGEKEALLLKPSTFDVASFVETFFQEIRGTESRRQFVAQLSRPTLTQMRQQILSGVLTSEAFSKLSESAFQTSADEEAENERIQQIIRAQEEEDKLNAIGTTMFECPNCKNRNATYHEQQTRGADEPTTKFVRCIDCKHRWTTE